MTKAHVIFIHFRVLLTQEPVSCHLAVLDVVKFVFKAAHEHLEFTYITFDHFRVLLTQESVSCHLAVLDVVKLVVKAAHEHLEFTSTQTDGKLFMPL